MRIGRKGSFARFTPPLAGSQLSAWFALSRFSRVTFAFPLAMPFRNTVLTPDAGTLEIGVGFVNRVLFDGARMPDKCRFKPWRVHGDLPSIRSFPTLWAWLKYPEG